MSRKTHRKSYAKCSICSKLSDIEYANQKHGWEENDTHFPDVAGKLETVNDLKPDSSRRARWLFALCDTIYIFFSFLVMHTHLFLIVLLIHNR